MNKISHYLKRMLPTSLKRVIASSIKLIAPKYYWSPTYNSIKQNFKDPEIRLLPFLCNPEMISIDVGASYGLYTVHMLDFSKSCMAFEARPSQALILKSMLAAFTKNASVEPVGLSEVNGEAILKILTKDVGRSTIEDENKLDDDVSSEREDIKIKIRKLDSYNLKNIGFIKIDVEGHELAVLHGAKETLANSLPSLLIEAEERHKKNSIKDVIAFLNEFGYSGFFILNGEVTPIEEFNSKIHQNIENVGNWKNNFRRKGLYINNFVFIPQFKVQTFLEEINKLSFK